MIGRRWFLPWLWLAPSLALMGRRAGCEAQNRPLALLEAACEHQRQAHARRHQVYRPTVATLPWRALVLHRTVRETRMQSISNLQAIVLRRSFAGCKQALTGPRAGCEAQNRPQTLTGRSVLWIQNRPGALTGRRGPRWKQNEALMGAIPMSRNNVCNVGRF